MGAEELDRPHVELRASHFRTRAKLLTDMAKTTGLAATAGGFLEPLVNHKAYEWANLGLGLAGLAFLSLAVYIAPHGEKHA